MTTADILLSCFQMFSLSVITQEYLTYVNQAHAVRGNDVLVKCDIPSIVTDFVSVTSWVDNDGGIFTADKQGKIDKPHCQCLALN